MKAELGLTGIAVPDAADLFLEARERRELVGERGAVGNYVALAGLAAMALFALTAGRMVHQEVVAGVESRRRA